MTRAKRFVIVGIAASLASLLVQQWALGFTDSTQWVTALRLLATLPLVYGGYTRYVLGELFLEERARLGALKTELKMVGRVASSLGASIGVKLLFEPFVTAFLLHTYGVRMAGLSVVIADFTYGPLVNFLVLVAVSRRGAFVPSRSMAPRIGALSVLPGWLSLGLRGAFALLSALRLWQSPRRTTGDFPTMTLADKLHWLYKADHPLLADELQIERRVRVKREITSATRRLRIHAVGDLLPYPRIDARSPLDPIADMLFSDLTVANLECPIGEHAAKRVVLDKSAAPSLALSSADFDALNRFDVIFTANNHSMDLGVEGVQATLEALEARGITAVGTNHTAGDALVPRIVERNGIRIGWVASTFGLNGHQPPEALRHLVDVEPLNAAVEIASLERRIRACKEAGAQLVAVSLHWGHEFEFGPRSQQRELARQLIEVGADILIGHHPHVIQPIEFLSSRNRIGLVLYSLGSLTNLLNFPAHSLSAVASIGVAVTDDGQVAVESAELCPVLQLVELEAGQPRAFVERLSKLLPSSDPFVTEATRYADHVLGPDWRQTHLPQTNPSYAVEKTWLPTS